MRALSARLRRLSSTSTPIVSGEVARSKMRCRFQWRFDVGVVEGKGAELADVLISLETFETQSRISVCTRESGDSAGAAGNQSRRSVECDVTALQFEGVTSVHVDGNRYLIQSRVSYEY